MLKLCIIDNHFCHAASTFYLLPYNSGIFKNLMEKLIDVSEASISFKIMY